MRKYRWIEYILKLSITLPHRFPVVGYPLHALCLCIHFNCTGELSPCILF